MSFFPNKPYNRANVIKMMAFKAKPRIVQQMAHVIKMCVRGFREGGAMHAKRAYVIKMITSKAKPRIAQQIAQVIKLITCTSPPTHYI